MERRLARIIAVRLALFLLPFVIWFVWREVARRSGRPMGSTPWTPLIAIGALLAAGSLIASVLVDHSPDTGVYVPAEVRPDGTVAPGRYVPRKAG